MKTSDIKESYPFLTKEDINGTFKQFEWEPDIEMRKNYIWNWFNVLNTEKFINAHEKEKCFFCKKTLGRGIANVQGRKELYHTNNCVPIIYKLMQLSEWNRSRYIQE